MKSYVYILPLKDKKLLKIGRTNNLPQRVASLSMFYKFDKEKAFVLECLTSKESISLENTLHKVFHSNRVILNSPGGTEFFNDSIYGDIHKMIKIISSNQNTILFKISQTFAEVENFNESEKCFFAICDTIKNKRLLLNISQKQLSNMTKISKRTIERIENYIGSPSILIIIKILKALNIEMLIYQMTETKTIRQRQS